MKKSISMILATCIILSTGLFLFASAATAVNDYYQTNDVNVYYSSAPSKSTHVGTIANKGTIVYIVSKTQNSAGNWWYLVGSGEYKDKYIFESNLSKHTHTLTGGNSTYTYSDPNDCNHMTRMTTTNQYCPACGYVSPKASTKDYKESHTFSGGLCIKCSRAQVSTTRGDYLASKDTNVKDSAEKDGKSVKEVSKGTFIYISEVNLNPSTNNYWGTVKKVGNSNISGFIYMGNVTPHTHSYTGGVSSYTYSDPNDCNHLTHKSTTKMYCTTCNYVTANASKKDYRESHTFSGGLCTKCSRAQVPTTGGDYLAIKDTNVKDSAEKDGKSVKAVSKGTFIRISSAKLNTSTNNYWGKVTIVGNSKVSGFIYMGNVTPHKHSDKITYTKGDYFKHSTKKVCTVCGYTTTASESHNFVSGVCTQCGQKSITATLSGITSVKVTSATTTSVSLTWTKISAAKGYVIYKYNSSSAKYEKYATVSSNSCTVKELSAGHSYKIKIRAYKDISDKRYYGEYSCEITTVTCPSKPSKLKASTQSSDSVTLKWNSTGGATGYEVARYDTSASAWNTITTVNTNSYTVTGLAANTSYKFRVRAYKTGNAAYAYGSYSDALTTYTGPAKIMNLTASKVTYDASTISWSAPSGAIKYNIYNVVDGKTVYITTQTKTSYTFSKLLKDQIYQVAVRAYYTKNDKNYYSTYCYCYLPTLAKTVSASYASGQYYSKLVTVKLTGDQRADIVKIALSQEGYREGKNSNDLSGASTGTSNYTEYCRWYGRNENWCAIFISWCAEQASIPTTVINRTNTPSASAFHITKKNFNDYKTKVQLGDIAVINGDGNHAALIYDVDDTYIYTIDGNWSQSVKKNKYLKSNGVVSYGGNTITSIGVPSYQIVKISGKS